MNSTLALEKLDEMVKSKELFFRDSAVFILGSIGDEKCLSKLIDVVLTENDEEILKKAISALSLKGTQETLKKLSNISVGSIEQFRAGYINQIVESIRRRTEKTESVEVEALSGDDVDSLHELLKVGTTDEKVRACQRLCEIGGEESVPYLMEARNDSATSVRYNAKKALNMIQRRVGFSKRENVSTHSIGGEIKKIIPVEESKNAQSSSEKMKKNDGSTSQMEEIDMVFLILDLDSENPNVRAEAVSKLMYADKNTKGVQEALKYLVERLEKEEDPTVKSQILRVIGKLGDESHLELLKSMLENPESDYRIRANALEGLGYIDVPNIFEYIVPYLSDNDNRIKANAVIAAWKHDKESTFKIIADMMKSGDVTMRDSAAYSLLVLKPRDAKVISLVKESFIKEIEPDVINKLANCLAELGDEKMVEEFKGMVTHASSLKKPYIMNIINKIEKKLNSAGNIQESELIKGETASEQVESEEYVRNSRKVVEKRVNLIDRVPEYPKSIKGEGGEEIPLKTLQAHILEFNHPDEQIRSNSIRAIKVYLQYGIPEKVFGEVEMLLSLAMNDTSLGVRKLAFEAYQLIKKKEYTLIREE
jgi:HEAT repeat protein